MTCEEFKALAPAWALGALEEGERLAFEAHLAAPRLHEGCETALALAEEAAQLLALELKPVVPPEAVWNAIESQLALQTDSAVRRASVLPRWSRLSRTLALAASVAVVSLIIGNRLGRDEGEKASGSLKAAQARTASDLSLAQTARSQAQDQFEACRRDLKAADDAVADRQRALNLLADPTTEVVDLASQPKFNASGRVILNRGKREAIVFAKSLSPIADRDYELWIIRDGNKFPVGLLKLETSGSALARIDNEMLRGGPNVFAITLEPAGGGPVPLGPVVLLGAVKKG